MTEVEALKWLAIVVAIVGIAIVLALFAIMAAVRERPR